MKTLNYLASLLPSFGKDRVTEDCRLTRADIKDVTQPAYQLAVQGFKGYKFKSPQLQEQVAIFGRMVKGKGSNMVEVINDKLDELLKNLDEAEDLIEKTFSQEVASAGLTYLKANLLQFVEAIHFASKFARKFLLYVYICETAEHEDGGTVVAESMTPAELDYIKANFVTFCQVLNVTTGDPAHVRKALNDIPDIVVTEENVGTLGSTVGEKKLDPFQMKLIPIILNPVYHIGMFVAEWQADRYKVAKEELKMVQLRKLNLEKVTAGKPDAAVQKEISYLETRIQGLNYKIAKMEKDYA
jgi:hypothetical protein